jgi:hypothetical protein
MAENIAFDGPGAAPHLAHMQMLISHLKGFQSGFHADLAGIPPMGTRAASELDVSIFETDRALTEISVGVLTALIATLQSNAESTKAATDRLNGSGQIAEGKSDWGSRGGHH